MPVMKKADAVLGGEQESCTSCTAGTATATPAIKVSTFKGDTETAEPAGMSHKIDPMAGENTVLQKGF